jgi:protein-L-isoaspartate(D-aspartate) O-methyltransferase
MCRHRFAVVSGQRLPHRVPDRHSLLRTRRGEIALAGSAVSSDRYTPSPADLATAARAAGVADERLLAAIAQVPRALFVPRALAARAYVDDPLRITHRQVTTQRSLVAKMVEALALRGEEEVLEIGTGYGYQIALLGRIAGKVVSVGLWQDMSDAARVTLNKIGVANVTLIAGDGTRGVPDQAPFDAIVVTAAFPSVPPRLAEQLVRGGRLVQPIGPRGREDVRLFEKDGNELVGKRSMTAACFVHLYGRNGYPLAQAPAEP